MTLYAHPLYDLSDILGCYNVYVNRVKLCHIGYGEKLKEILKKNEVQGMVGLSGDRQVLMAGLPRYQVLFPVHPFSSIFLVKKFPNLIFLINKLDVSRPPHFI